MSSSSFTLLGLVSSYKEGNLLRLAVESAERACDRVLVFEGPAGPPLEEEVPESVLPLRHGKVSVKRGVWKTDAAKRTAMVKATRGFSGVVWAVWVDGDEVLVNGEFLRDQLQSILWRDQDAEQPTAGFPIRIVEMDGSVAVCRAKVVRVDLIERYLVSSSGIQFRNGVVMAEGNLPQKVSEWWTAERVRAAGEDRFFLEPPLPGEPFLVHRSPLRHPARARVRMHEQEAAELRRLGLVES